MAKKTIKAQMKQRRDTKANWASTNPVLLAGELGIVSDDPNLYKVGDGTTAWNALPFRGFDGTLAQELGTSPNAVISQKVVSEKLTELESEENAKLYAESAFALTPSSTHSSQKDKAFINIKKGDSYFVEIQMDSYVWGQIFVYYADGTNEVVQVIENASVTYEKTAKQDIIAVSLFTERGNGNVFFKVWSRSSLHNRIIEAETEIKKTARNTKYGYSEFVVSNNVGHSSDIDLIYINIQKGEEFYVNVQMSAFIYNEIYAFYEDGSKVSIRKNTTQTPDTYKFIASSNIVAFGLYVMAVDAEVVFSVEKYTLLNKQTDTKIAEISDSTDNAILELKGNVSFNVTEGVNHSSSLDRLPVNIKQGEPFIFNLALEHSDQFWQLFAIAKDKSENIFQSMGSLKNKYFVAPFDIESFGLYVDARYSTSVYMEIFSGWKYKIQDAVFGESITMFNGGYTELQARFKDLRKYYGVYGNPTYGNKPCNILFTSDAHNAVNNLQRIIQFNNEFADYIDDMLHGGDAVVDQYVDDNPFANIDGGEKFLNTIGNHDNWDTKGVTGVAINQRVPQKEVYDKFFAPYIANWNVTQPNNAAIEGYCYYYKDYSESMMRLIVLDCMNWNSHQSSWLSSVLDSAIANGYHVMICNHYAPNDKLHGIRECTFESIYSDDSVFVGSSLPDEVSELVQSKIDNGLNFIAWIFGHFHQDKFGYLVNYPNQHYISVDKTAGDPGWGWERDSARAYGRSIDGFDIISVDTTFSILTIMRIGQNRDKFMRQKNYLTFDYKNGKILSNS